MIALRCMTIIQTVVQFSKVKSYGSKKKQVSITNVLASIFVKAKLKLFDVHNSGPQKAWPAAAVAQEPPGSKCMRRLSNLKSSPIYTNNFIIIYLLNIY